jgi:hypothetical protein
MMIPKLYVADSTRITPRHAIAFRLANRSARPDLRRRAAAKKAANIKQCAGRPRAMGNRYRIVPHKVAKKPHSIRASMPRRANSRRRRHNIVAAYCRLRHTNRLRHRLLINRHASLRRGEFSD